MTSVTLHVWFPGVSCGQMSTNDPSAGNAKNQASPWKENAPAGSQADDAATKPGHAHYAEMQSAPRFPIKLPVSVKSKTGESLAETENISANGVLFQVAGTDMPVGSAIDFTISLPADIVGADVDVRLDCKGRVVRNFDDAGRHGVGVVIDEYKFDRR
jgi:hypothetical protein